MEATVELKRGSAEAAGLDLYPSEEVRVQPGEIRLVPTGVRMAIDPGYVGLIRDRSGMALKRGIHTLAGVIDSDYRGEIGVVVVNLSKTTVVLKEKAVAQMIIVPYWGGDVKVVTELDDSVRGSNGFGSTGC